MASELVGPVRARAVLSGSRGAPSVVPRQCELVFSRLEQLQPFEDARPDAARTLVYSITVALEGSKSALRSPDIAVPSEREQKLDTRLDFTCQLEYLHDLKNPGTIVISLQRRKQNRPRPGFGMKTLCTGAIDLAQLLQCPLRDPILLFAKDGSPPVARVHLVAQTQPLSGDGGEEPVIDLASDVDDAELDDDEEGKRKGKGIKARVRRMMHAFRPTSARDKEPGEARDERYEDEDFGTKDDVEDPDEPFRESYGGNSSDETEPSGPVAPRIRPMYGPPISPPPDPALVRLQRRSEDFDERPDARPRASSLTPQPELGSRGRSPPRAADEDLAMPSLAQQLSLTLARDGPLQVILVDAGDLRAVSLMGSVLSNADPSFPREACIAARAADLALVMAAVLQRIQALPSKAQILRLAVVADDAFLHALVRQFVASFASRDAPVGQLCFHPAPCDRDGLLPGLLAATDTDYRQLFYPAIGDQLAPVDFVRAVAHYLTAAASIVQLDIGEALVTAAAQLVVPFVHSVRVGSMDDDASCEDCVDLQVDYWRQARDDKASLRDKFVFLSVSPLAQTDSMGRRAPMLALRALQREKKSVLQALKLTTRQRLPPITPITKLVCAPERTRTTVSTVVIDGVTYPDVRFFSLSPQLPSAPKTLPVAALGGPAPASPDDRPGSK
eukprot:m.162242 g.162242  ORF g.162242 m.162242 type:complete len:673 (+) comp15201_c3_seq25:874-2892(+)